MQPIKIVNYQGNKASLMPFISNNIYKYVSDGDEICDIFSGSGSVGAYFKSTNPIISNDSELFSSIISSALLNTPSKEKLITVNSAFNEKYKTNYKSLSVKRLSIMQRENNLLKNNNNIELLKMYKEIPTVWNDESGTITPKILKQRNSYNLFLYYYAGTYFGIKQSIQIDSIIKTIDDLHYDNNTKNVLKSCLFYAMNEAVFSKDGHMAQPLSIEKNPKRHIKQRRKDLLQLFQKKLSEFINSNEFSKFNNKSIIFNEDMSDLLKDNSFKKLMPKLIYADPPYTDMQYSRYYHLLNVAAKYNYPELTINRGKYTKGLYTEGRNQSDLSKKSTAKDRLHYLMEYCFKNNIVLALSYAYPKNKKEKSDRYTVSINELIEMANTIFGKKLINVKCHDYTHANNRNHSTKSVVEYLILCGNKKEIKKDEDGYDILKIKKDIKNIIPTSRNPLYNSHLYWSQKSFNIIDILIKELSKKGETVFDPFMGSGVTIFEAVKNKMSRNGIGCDVNDMSKFISDNVLSNIPNSDLQHIFDKFNKKLNDLENYYETKCINCNSIGRITKVVFDKPERIANDYTIKAINYKCPNCGKMVKEPDSEDYNSFLTYKCTHFVPNISLLKDSKIAVGDDNKISDIFTPRNFSVLNEIVGYIKSIKSLKHRQVLNYLLMSILHLTKITDTHSNSQWPLWIPKKNCVEKNIIDVIDRKEKALIKAQIFIKNNYSNSSLTSKISSSKTNEAVVLTKGSQFINNEEVPNDSVSLIITDPPYMDQVMYSEYMQLYKPFIGINFNTKDEIIVSNSKERNKDKKEYFILLNKVFKMCSKKLKENNIMCLYFHDSNLTVWVELLEVLEVNGFKFISLEHISKNKTVKNILSPKKSLSGDSVLFFENTRHQLPNSQTNLSCDEIKYYVFIEAKKLLEINGDLSTPELYDMGIMELLIDNGWLKTLSTKYKSLVEIFEEYFIWKKESSKWHLQ